MASRDGLHVNSSRFDFMQYEIYTDGACSVAKRVGGYAAIAMFEKQQIVVHGNKKNTTNNEMELFAVIAILRILTPQLKKGDKVLVYSDSAYVVNAVRQQWIRSWSVAGWCTKEGRPVKNKSLWVVLLSILDDFARLGVLCDFVKVKGHSSCKFNNYVDRLAVKESQLLKI